MVVTTNRTGRAASRQPHAGAAATRLGDPVLDAALDLFDQVGWEHSSLEQVASAAKEPLEKVLRRFPTRDHLAAAIFDRVLDAVIDELSTEITARASLEERLLAILTQEIVRLEPHRRFARKALGRILNPFAPSLALQARLAVRFIAYVTEQIAEARDRREVGFWVIPSVAATAFWGLHLQILIRWLNDDTAGFQEPLASADRWIRAFMRTLGASRGTRSSVPLWSAIRGEDDREQEPVLFEDTAGQRVFRDVEVTNDRPQTIEARVGPTSFTSAVGHTIRPGFTFEPGSAWLAPGQSVVVRATVMLTRGMAPEVDYRGELEVEGLPSSRIAVVLRRRAAKDPVVFEGPAGRSLTCDLPVRNSLNHKIKACFQSMSFTSPLGHTIDPELTFEPESVWLDPGQSIVFKATATLSSQMVPEVDYYGELEVDQLPDTRITVVLRSQGALTDGEGAGSAKPKRRPRSKRVAKKPQ
jgi:AcrR family transcriptional regulator